VHTVADETLLDFGNCPEVIVEPTGGLKLEPTEIRAEECATKPAAWMGICAGNLIIQGGGEITASHPLEDRPSRMLNAGTIYIGLTRVAKAVGTTAGDLIIEPGGKLTSERHGRGNGRSGIIAVEAQGEINVMASTDGAVRGLISTGADSSALFAFGKGCGRSEITLLAEGNGAPLDSAGRSQAIVIAGTVESAKQHGEPGDENFLGGVITLIGGVKVDKGFPTPFDPHLTDPHTYNFRTSLPVNKPNPPDDQATVRITETGLINVNALDHGGGEVRIDSCYVFNHGVIQVGGDPHDGSVLGRETVLPTLVEIIAHEDIAVMPVDLDHASWDVTIGPGKTVKGGIRADLRQGWRQHVGQGLTDPALRTGEGCNFVLQDTQPQKNEPNQSAGRGGADVCLIAGRSILVDSMESTEFAVRARTGSFSGASSSNQTGGTILALTTRAGGEITLENKALTTNGVKSNANGGLVVVQSTKNVTVTDPPPDAIDPDDSDNPNNAECYGNINANGGGKATNKGGSIWLEATNGAITDATGKLCAVPGGSIHKRECVVNTGDNPQSDPAEVDLNPACGDPQLVRILPLLLPCVECSCIDDVSLSGVTVTISGHSLDAVKQVAFAPNCAPDEDTDPCVMNAPFPRQEETVIELELPSCVESGDHAIVGDPGVDNILGTDNDVSPSISCSRATYPF
jgi:hypothetical protein